MIERVAAALLGRKVVKVEEHGALDVVASKFAMSSVGATDSSR